MSITFNDDLALAMERANIGLAQIGIDECFEQVNGAFAAMLGRTCEQLQGESWRSSVHPEDHGRVEEAYETARSALKGFVEIRGLCAGGTTIYQAVTVIRREDASGQMIGFHCLRHDITGRKCEQQALALAVESAPSGLLMLNSEGRIQTVNVAVEKLFGYSRLELIGKSVEMLLPERWRGSDDVTSAAMAGRDITGLRKDGVEIPMQVYLNTIEVPGGKLILCTLIDIAERVRHAEQLQLATKAAELANRTKSDFLARMSHEIRTPMNLIMGMNALLLESELSDKQRQQVAISYRNVRRLLRLINGILDLSKVEAGKLHLVSEPFDLREVLSETADTISAAIEAKELEFRLNISSKLWPFWTGDAERLQQILLNLVGNSVKFTERGHIQLSAFPVQSASGEQGVCFEVSDTGCGVPAKQMSRIFEAFEQGDEGMNRNYEGSGLGLAIAKMLVNLMGGSIWVEEQGIGAKFVFTTFFAKAGLESVKDRSAEFRNRRGIVNNIKAGTRILVAEDNPENVILVEAYLEGLPVVLDFAANGVIACEKRREKDYDLVLMDIQMPLMDGYTATKTIREWEKRNGQQPVTIIALTAHALSHAMGESREAGCNGHISKPVNREELVGAIACATNRVRQESASQVPKGIASKIPAFLTKRVEDAASVKAALQARDFARLQHIGHNCKGIGKGFGFPEISLAGAALENAARGENIMALQQAVQQFTEAVDAAVSTGGN